MLYCRYWALSLSILQPLITFIYTHTHTLWIISKVRMVIFQLLFFSSQFLSGQWSVFMLTDYFYKMPLFHWLALSTDHLILLGWNFFSLCIKIFWTTFMRSIILTWWIVHLSQMKPNGNLMNILSIQTCNKNDFISLSIWQRTSFFYFDYFRLNKNCRKSNKKWNWWKV